MPPGSQPSFPLVTTGLRARRHRQVTHAMLLGACALCFVGPVAWAQDGAIESESAPAPSADNFWTVGKPPAPPPAYRIPPAENEGDIAFAADELNYDTDTDVVTASGDVILRRDGQELQANAIRWDRKSGQIVASGNIRLLDAGGNILYSDELELSDELRAGAMENILLVMNETGRLAAKEGERLENGDAVLRDVAYTPCAIETPQGCPKEPSWRITARRVLYSQETGRVRFIGARLRLFGVPLLPLPGLMINAGGQPTSGITTPNLRFSDSNGVELLGEYYWRLAPNRELTLGASVYTDVLPMLSARYAALTEAGAYQITGYATNSSRIPIGGDTNTVATSEKDLRGYLDSNGRFQLDPNWSVTGSLRFASDRTFLRRYDVSRDDRLRSMARVERIDDESYFSLSGWAVQTLQQGDDQGLIPIALPLIDYRRNIGDPLLDGRITLQANTLMLTRTDGQDTQRAFAGATWSLRKMTGLGQEVTFTALTRADVYHSDENGATTVEIYRGDSGWLARGVAIGAIDMKWPFVGNLFGGSQVLTPRVQLVASPKIRNLDIPNEDARAVDLEDSNLFALNRFAGYDRVESGPRVTYGLDWRWIAPGWRIESTIGQSFRLNSEEALLPDGTGLTSRTSDIVGRAEVRFRDYVSFTSRFRLDKDNFAIRRNEFDVTVGSRKTYVQAGYLKLNRNIPDTLEDLRDREEVRVAARLAFANYWSVFGSTVINLTDRAEDPTNDSDGFEPLRTRLGVAYDDDCTEIALTWRRDSFATGDARRGNTFLFRFRLKNLGPG